LQWFWYIDFHFSRQKNPCFIRVQSVAKKTIAPNASNARRRPALPDIPAGWTGLFPPKSGQKAGFWQKPPVFSVF
jgi:hypothetical protein